MDATSQTRRAGTAQSIAVLGGTGFVGRPVCRALAAKGHHVVVVARRRPTPDLAVEHGPGGFVAMDLATATVDEVAGMLGEHGIGTIVNAAGGMWGLTDEEMVAANLTLVQHVIEAAATAPRRIRLVQLSTVHEYGVVPVGISMAEEDEPRPIKVYGQLKLRCTEAVTEATRRGGIDGVSVRIGNVVGAGQPAQSLLGVVARQLWDAHTEGRSAVLRLGPLGSRCDFLNLSDAVDAIVAAVTAPELPGEVFNVGTGRATSARDMVRLLIGVSGVSTELIEAQVSGQAESTWQQMRIDKARRLLGWSPTGDLVDGMKELWEHHAENASA
jgi:dTDP-6-deoxy-L-talose 4-dehydrogenase [NAD(P)+]